MTSTEERPSRMLERPRTRSSWGVRPVASSFVEPALSDTSPDLDLLSSVEKDMAKVDQALRDLDDEALDPGDVIGWLPDAVPAPADVTKLVDDVTTEGVTEV